MIRAGLLELPFKKVMDHLHALTPNNQRPIWTIQRRVPYPGLSKAFKAIPHGLVHLPAIQGIAGGHTHAHRCADIVHTRLRGIANMAKDSTKNEICSIFKKELV